MKKALVPARPKTTSAFELGKDLFGKYASSDDSGSTNRRAHRAAGLGAKDCSLNNLLN
jgi:hypothetical protein